MARIFKAQSDIQGATNSVMVFKGIESVIRWIDDGYYKTVK